jgi:hypothetical protein
MLPADKGIFSHDKERVFEPEMTLLRWNKPAAMIKNTSEALTTHLKRIRFNGL